MSQEVFIRGLFCSIVSLILTWNVFSRFDHEVGSEVEEHNRQRYLPYLPGNTLPFMLLAICLLGIFLQSITWSVRLLLSVCFSVFLHISLYYLLLLPALPWLRRHFSARACAMLWLLPNFLYVFCYDFMELPSPVLVIRLPGVLPWILLGIWFAGFVGVMLWKCIEHLRFRRWVLQDARPVTDPQILQVWQALLQDTKVKVPKQGLMETQRIDVPLTVGLFSRSVRVLLPRKAYTQEELSLVLHHEIVHIGREDAWSKFFLVFCTAVCWFQPLMWIAMQKSAEDIELSCDETVLLQADADTRKRYAYLLLDTAGDARGFTTCLSASAETMRYRLSRIIKPGKRRSGALLVGAIFFVLTMSVGYVSLAYGSHKGDQVLDCSGSAALNSLVVISDGDRVPSQLTDRECFDRYIAELTLYDLTGNYSFSNSEYAVSYVMKTSEESWLVNLYDQGITVRPLFGKERYTLQYYVPEGIDWDYLSTVFYPFPAAYQ